MAWYRFRFKFRTPANLCIRSGMFTNMVTNNLVAISSSKPSEALDNLNRVTGLEFQRYPESLVNSALNAGLPQNGEENEVKSAHTRR